MAKSLLVLGLIATTLVVVISEYYFIHRPDNLVILCDPCHVLTNNYVTYNYSVFCIYSNHWYGSHIIIDA